MLSLSQAAAGQQLSTPAEPINNDAAAGGDMIISTIAAPDVSESSLTLSSSSSSSPPAAPMESSISVSSESVFVSSELVQLDPEAADSALERVEVAIAPDGQESSSPISLPAWLVQKLRDIIDKLKSNPTMKQMFISVANDVYQAIVKNKEVKKLMQLIVPDGQPQSPGETETRTGGQNASLAITQGTNAIKNTIILTILTWIFENIRVVISQLFTKILKLLPDLFHELLREWFQTQQKGRVWDMLAQLMSLVLALAVLTICVVVLVNYMPEVVAINSVAAAGLLITASTAATSSMS